MSLQKDDNPGINTESGVLVFMQGILEPFKEELQISHVEQSSEPAPKVACLTFVYQPVIGSALPAWTEKLSMAQSE